MTIITDSTYFLNKIEISLNYLIFIDLSKQAPVLAQHLTTHSSPAPREYYRASIRLFGPSF